MFRALDTNYMITKPFNVAIKQAGPTTWVIRSAYLRLLGDSLPQNERRFSSLADAEATLERMREIYHEQLKQQRSEPKQDADTQTTLDAFIAAADSLYADVIDAVGTDKAGRLQELLSDTIVIIDRLKRFDVGSSQPLKA